MSDVFISYTRGDRERVQALADLLRDRGLDVWWDRNIIAGSEWDEEIERQINAARCVVVAWSKESVRRPWVRAEADLAKARDVLVPVLLDPVDPPLAFRLTQAADLIGWQPGRPHPGIDQLLEAIAGKSGKEPGTTRDQPPRPSRPAGPRQPSQVTRTGSSGKGPTRVRRFRGDGSSPAPAPPSIIEGLGAVVLQPAEVPSITRLIDKHSGPQSGRNIAGKDGWAALQENGLQKAYSNMFSSLETFGQPDPPDKPQIYLVSAAMLFGKAGGASKQLEWFRANSELSRQIKNCVFLPSDGLGEEAYMFEGTVAHSGRARYGAAFRSGNLLHLLSAHGDLTLEEFRHLAETVASHELRGGG